ncbi:hypothetical protein MT068_001412 [Salmonella enterica]|nr:hypothetical protein [Salmonella enterica]
MHVFEFRNKSTDKRVIIIGETYRAYEQVDGSVILNDEKAGFSFYPEEPYEEFRKQFNLDWRKHLNTFASSAILPTTSIEPHNG